MSVTADFCPRPKQFARFVALVVGLATAANADPYRLNDAADIGQQVCHAINPNTVDPTDLTADNGRWRRVEPSRFAFFVSSYASNMDAPEDALKRLRALDGLAQADSLVIGAILDHAQSLMATKSLAPLAAFDSDGHRLNYSDVEKRGIRHGAWLRPRRCAASFPSRPNRTHSWDSRFDCAATSMRWPRQGKIGRPQPPHPSDSIEFVLF